MRLYTLPSFHIGKWAMVFVLLWQLRHGQFRQDSLFATYCTKVRGIHRSFYKWKIKDDNQKKFILIGNWYRIFSFHICQSFYDAKPQLAIRCLIAKYWLSQDGERPDFFLKTSAPLSLMMTNRMSLISAGSISLDSTFKYTVCVSIKSVVQVQYHFLKISFSRATTNVKSHFYTKNEKNQQLLAY